MNTNTARQRIIDVHIHHADDAQIASARELGYDKIGLIEPRLDVLRERMRTHPDFVIGIGWLPMDRDIPQSALDMIDRFRDIGCRGYKVCFTSRPYDDESYYPIYQKIQETGLPVFFHTGWLDQRVALEVYPTECKPRASFYHPMTLDRLTLDFPRLRMTAYHLGGSYISDCALLMRNHANLYADTCRSFDPFDFFVGEIGGAAGVRAVFGKLMVGTDGLQAPQGIRQRIEELGRLMDHLAIPEGLRQRVYYKTALRVLGMDEELKRTAMAGEAPADLDRMLVGTLPKAAAESFVDQLGQAVAADTQCWIACTETGLRLVFRCADEHAGQVAITRDCPLGDIWQDDSVEVFLAPGGRDAGTYWHVVASAGGRAFVHQGRYGTEPQELAAQAKIGTTSWAVAVEVPRSILGGRPAAGARWGLNLCRTRTTGGGQISSWNEVASTFHDPAAFGWLKFG